MSHRCFRLFRIVRRSDKIESPILIFTVFLEINRFRRSCNYSEYCSRNLIGCHGLPYCTLIDDDRTTMNVTVVDSDPSDDDYRNAVILGCGTCCENIQYYVPASSFFDPVFDTSIVVRLIVE